ncbi:MAG: CBS domain-containing protein [Isosphaeraceae bacterium]
MPLFGSNDFAKLTASDVMTPAPRTCSPFSTVLEAVMIFRDADCSAVPITEDGRAIGILTDRDVALALAEFPDLAMHAVEDVMTRQAVTVRANAPMTQVREVFSDQGIGRLLVVDANDQLVGIISRADIAARLVDDVVSDVVEQR